VTTHDRKYPEATKQKDGQCTVQTISTHILLLSYNCIGKTGGEVDLGIFLTLDLGDTAMAFQL
jgi:hypothetical protein